MLSTSLKEKNEQTLSASDFYGCWGDDGMETEEFINELFRCVNIVKYPIILDFLECPKDLIDIFIFNMDCLIEEKNNSTCFIF